MPLASTWSLEVSAGHAKEAGAGREAHTTSVQARRAAGGRHKVACPRGQLPLSLDSMACGQCGSRADLPLLQDKLEIWNST